MEEKKHPISRIAHETNLRAAKLGINQEALSKMLGLSAEHLSRWRRGIRNAPDPRSKSSRTFYINLAKFLERTPGEVLAELLFFDMENSVFLSPWIEDGVGSVRNQSIPSLSSKGEETFKKIRVNLTGREDYVVVLMDSFQIYVETVLKERWYEDEISWITAHQKKRGSE